MNRNIDHQFNEIRKEDENYFTETGYHFAKLARQIAQVSNIIFDVIYILYDIKSTNY